MTVNNRASRRPLKVAIIGGGPGGLGAAIALGKLPFVDWTLYEKKPKISETGGGISIPKHTWKMLEWNGVAKHLHPDDFFRQTSGSAQFRNGRTGAFIHDLANPPDTPPHRISCRLVRSKLQAALLKEVDQTRVKTSKKLVNVQKLPSGKVAISFEDGEEDEVDLLVAADGIRSAVRSIVIPSHAIKYNGQSAYRTIISKAAVRRELGDAIPEASVFWQNLGSKYVFTSPLGNDDFEVTARIGLPADDQEHVSWGRPYDLSQLIPQYDEFHEPLRRILHMVAEAGGTQEFALFSGPRLSSVVALDGAVVLVGDASHPLSGAYGGGAGFALEDTYALYKALEWAWTHDRPLSLAARAFDEIRSPHYDALYDTLDWLGGIMKAVTAENLPIDQEIEQKVLRTSVEGSGWMYDYDIRNVVDSFLDKFEATANGA